MKSSLDLEQEISVMLGDFFPNQQGLQ